MSDVLFDFTKRGDDYPELRLRLSEDKKLLHMKHAGLDGTYKVTVEGHGIVSIKNGPTRQIHDDSSMIEVKSSQDIMVTHPLTDTPDWEELEEEFREIQQTP